MKKRYILGFLLLLATAFVFYLWQTMPDEDNDLSGVMPETGESAAAMSIKGLEIQQGEEGKELWRLKAEGAVMSQQGGDIVAQKPFLTYYLRSEADGAETVDSIMTVESLSGDVNQKDNRIRFVGEVRVEHEDDVLETALIIYEGAENHLECPEFSVLTRPGMRGEAAEVVWDLDKNILRATNGVNIDLETDRAPGPPLRAGEDSVK